MIYLGFCPQNQRVLTWMSTSSQFRKLPEDHFNYFDQERDNHFFSCYIRNHFTNLAVNKTIVEVIKYSEFNKKQSFHVMIWWKSLYATYIIFWRLTRPCTTFIYFLTFFASIWHKTRCYMNKLQPLKQKVRI